MFSALRLGGLLLSSVYGGLQLAQTAFGLPIGLGSNDAQTLFWIYIAIVIFFLWNIGFYWNGAHALEIQRPKIVLKGLNMTRQNLVSENGEIEECAFMTLVFNNEPDVNVKNTKAENVTAEIKLFEKSLGHKIPKGGFGIWIKSDVAITRDFHYSISKADTQHTIDLAPNGLPANLLIVIKHPARKAFYVLTSDCQDYRGWIKPTNELDDEDEVLRIIIRGENVGPHRFDIPIDHLRDESISDLTIIDLNIWNRVEVDRGKYVSKSIKRNVNNFFREFLSRRNNYQIWPK